VTSNSHKAINNLLSQIEELAIEEKFTFKGFKKSSKPDDKLNGKIIDDIGSVKKDYDYTNQLFAGTAWLFSDARLNQKIDYLFVDEAGQVSLANTLAMSTSAKNIILIGDQMQLSQPIKGTHAGDAGKSSLEYLLSDYDTIPTNKGIFLDKTRRLNYKICDYISDSFYDSRLKPHEITKERHVKLQSKSIQDEGITFLPMSHLNCSQKSDEEVKEINSMMKAAVGKSCKDSGTTKERKINLEDILIVAPFNMQVNNLS
jgi:superfamily I DNA and/or RNA helicase